MNKIIIFGTSGNIGQYMVDYFLNELQGEYEIIGVDIHPHTYVEKRIQFYQMDINDKQAFEQLPKENIHAVIDLIGPMPARMLGYHPEEYIQTNIIGSYNIFEYCIANHVDRILYAKSFCDILKRSEETPVLTVDMEPYFDYDNQHAVYCVSQNTAMELLKCMHAYYGIKTFIFRLPHIYLWSQNDSYSVKGVPHKMMHRIIIDNAMEGKPVEVWGDASRKKDMVYVKDLCQMFFKACFVERDYGFYNVGTGIGTSLLEQIEGMIEVFGPEGRKSEMIMCPEKPNAPQYIMDIKEAKEELGYSPQYSYIEMLKDMKKEYELGRF